MLGVQGFGLLIFLVASGEASNASYTVAIFLRSPREAELTARARRVSDPRDEIYGEFFSQTELRGAVAVPLGEALLAASALRLAVASALHEDALLASLGEAQVVAHGDAARMAVPDFFATYDLAQILNTSKRVEKDLDEEDEEYAEEDGEDGEDGRKSGVLNGKFRKKTVTRRGALAAFPPGVQLLVTPPMPEGLCEAQGEVEDQCRRPCRWHRRHKSNHSNHSEATSNFSEASKSSCRGDFAGWICWRDGDAWQCFEPADFQGVNSSSSRSNRRSLRRSRRRRSRRRRSRRRRGVSTVSAMQLMERREHRRFHVLARSGGFSLLCRNETFFLQDWLSLEVSFVQNELVQNRLLKKENFERRGAFHRAPVGGLKNLHHVEQIFVCFNVVEMLAPPGQLGCDCNATENGRDRHQRECQKAWSLTPQREESGAVLPRAVQSLDALYRDLEVPAALEPTEQGSQAVAQFNEEAFLQRDVAHLHRAYGLSSATKIRVHGPRGKVDNSDSGGEGSLDLQTITSLAQRARTTWWGIDPRNVDGFMLAYVMEVNDDPEPPLVHSVSWGDAEALYPKIFVNRLDYELMKLALRGVTVIVASGDNGNSAVGSDCDFVPDVVGTSEWVTSVGATMPSRRSKPYCSEEKFRHLGDCEELGQVVCSTEQGALITSSGYFSVYRPRPEYQEAAVKTYLQTNCSPCTLHEKDENATEKAQLKVPCQHISSSGCSLQALLRNSRAAPDVALPGQSYPVLVNESVFAFDGTSASAPALAALVSRLNGEQLRRKRPPLGLLNPWLYQVHAEHPEAFLDVVVGDTASTEARLCAVGFGAAPGWDAATGLGVPRFALLQRLLPNPKRASEQSSPQALVERTESIWPVATAVAVSLGAGALTSFLRRRDLRTWQLAQPLLRE